MFLKKSGFVAASLFALSLLSSITAIAQTPPPGDDDGFIVSIVSALKPKCQTPTITPWVPGQPVYAGQNITLGVTCTLNPTSYEWRLNGVVIPNATSATLTLPVQSGISTAVYSVVAIGKIRSSSVSAPSLTVLAAPNQTITFGAIANKQIGAAPFAVSAAASSGLPVTLTSTTPSFCSVMAGTVSVLAIGTCTIVASQAGNATYTAGLPVTQSFSITANLLPQAITGFAPFSTVSYVPNSTFSLSASGGSSGNPVVFASTTPSTCVVNGTTVTVVGAGLCTVTATQSGNATYQAATQIAASVEIKPVVRAEPSLSNVAGPAGKLAGAFSVGPAGSASYSIPIQAPPGTGGMVPAVSLNYDSGLGNGLVGAGWDIGGFGAITRCARTIAQDGVRAGVELSLNDKFCLDGQRLVLAPGAAYGAAGSEYRTEIESFAKVTAIGQLGSGPQSFSVKMKNGTTYEYGATADSRAIMSGHTTPTAWLVNKVTDSNQNYYTVTYTNDTANNQFYVARVDYTGNAASALAPYNSVRFSYDTIRTDVDVSYNNGAKISNVARLTNVTTYNGATTLVRNYKVVYQYSGPSGRSRVASVTECAGTGECLPATVFTWNNDLNIFAGPGSDWPVDNLAAKKLKNQWIDIDGDGKPDRCVINDEGVVPFGGGAHQYALYCYVTSRGRQLTVTSPSVMLFTAYNAPFPSTPLLSNYDVSVGDINGDGKMDVCQGSLCWISQGSSFASSFDAFGSATPSSGWALQDINGDGRADLYKSFTTPSSTAASPTSPAKWGMSAYYSQGNSFNTNGTNVFNDNVFTCYGSNCKLPVQWVDVTGDGVMSLCQRDVGTAETALANGVLRCRKLLGNGTFAPEVVSQTLSHLAPHKSPQHYAFQPGPGINFTPDWLEDSAWVDFNGDGKKDYCTATLDTNTVANPNVTLRCVLSTGTGFGDVITSAPMQLGTQENFQWMDINGDGKADFCGTVPMGAGKARKCILSTGAAFGVSVTSVEGSADGDFVDVDGNGLGALCFRTAAEAPTSITRCLGTTGKVPDLLASVADGLGASASVVYKPLTSPDVYTKGTAAAYPQVDVIDSRQVVSAVATSSGIGAGVNTTTYKYSTGRFDASGRDFRGFGTTEVNSPNSVTTTTTRSLDFPFYISTAGEFVEVKHAGVTILQSLSGSSATSPLTANGKNYLAVPVSNVTRTWDLNGAFQSWAETSFSNYDAYGNAQLITATHKDINGTADGFSESTTITYSNDTVNWVLGLPALQAVTRKSPEVPSGITRTTSLGYFPSGQVKQRVVEPNDAALKLTTDLTYDGFGNQLAKVTSGANITTRTESTITYDTKGRYPDTVTNALGHKETHTYNEGLGTRQSLKGPNDLTTSWTYDGFGRVKTETRSDGTVTATSYQRCIGCTTDSAYFVSRTNTVGGSGAHVSPPSSVYYDMLGREILTQVRAFNGGFQYTETFYDALGRVSRTLLPYYDTDTTTRAVTTQYDNLGRPAYATAPDTGLTTYDYNGRVTSVTNAKGQKKTSTKNSQGKTVSVTDAVGTGDASSVAYVYDPFGNLTKTTDALGNVIATQYDTLGRRKKLIDPDLGTWLYEYDVLGQLTKQTDAKGQSQVIEYDVLGRKKTQTATDLISTWYYETGSNGVPCTKGIGALCEAKTNNGYSRRLAYDNLGRLASSGTTIDNASDPYVASWSYDSAGRISVTSYPRFAGTALVPSSFKISYDYTSYGYTRQISDATPGRPAMVIWAANGKNADGNTLKETLGNGVVTNYAYDTVWGRLSTIKAGLPGATPNAVQNQVFDFDTLGNLKSRQDIALGTSEAFAYDSLNRLTCANLAGGTCTTGAAQTQSVSYDSIGNIKTKSSTVAGYQIGTYNYNPSGANSVRPHAVASITGSVNGLTNPGYAYDLNGSLESGGGRAATWTTFNMVKTLGKGGNTATFTYGAEQQRTMQTWPNAAAPGSTTVYLFDPHYEKVTTGTLVEHKYYISAGGRLLALFTKRNNSTEDLKYFHTDHIGSTSAVTNESGAVLERLAYDPWGDRRGASSTSPADVNNTIIPTTTNRGYTGHEQLDAGGMGLVHMNGRIYDPTIGKFLSADPILQAPFASQSFNRYSYVWNNPLTLTDPTGYQTFSLPPIVVRAPFINFEYGIVGISEVSECGCGRLAGSNIKRDYFESKLLKDFRATVKSSLNGLALTLLKDDLSVTSQLLAIGLILQVNGKADEESKAKDGLSADGTNAPETETSDSPKGKEPPVSDAKPGRETKGRAKQWEKSGGMSEADKDFDDKKPIDVIALPNGGRRGILPDGRQINVRPDSSDGRPTLEIQDGKNRIKVRYTE
jgi:RHS repeat-associated protein